jgi:hypothetical protein
MVGGSVHRKEEVFAMRRAEQDTMVFRNSNPLPVQPQVEISPVNHNQLIVSLAARAAHTASCVEHIADDDWPPTQTQIHLRQAHQFLSHASPTLTDSAQQHIRYRYCIQLIVPESFLPPNKLAAAPFS